MDPEIDRQISEHAARMHRYCIDDGGSFAVLQSNIFVFNSSILFICLIKDNLINCRIKRYLYKEGYAEEDDGYANAAIFCWVLLHGQDRRGKKAKQDRLIVKFVKKYIHYAKNLIQPKLTDEVTFSSIVH